MDNELTSWAAQDTADAYGSLGAAWHKPDVAQATFVVSNVHASNDAKFLIEGSIDGNTWATVVAEATLAHQASAAVVVNDYWPYLRIRIKAASAGSQARVSATAAAIEK